MFGTWFQHFSVSTKPLGVLKIWDPPWGTLDVTLLVTVPVKTDGCWSTRNDPAVEKLLFGRHHGSPWPVSPHVKSSHSSHWTGYQMARLASPSNRPSASRIVGLGSSQIPHENCYFFEEKTIHQGLLSYYFLIFRYSNIFKAPFGLAMHRSPTKTSAGLWSLGLSHCQQGQQKCTPQKHLGVDVDRPHSFQL